MPCEACEPAKWVTALAALGLSFLGFGIGAYLLRLSILGEGKR